MSVPDAPSNLPPAHYFNEDPEVPSARKRIDVSLPDGSFSIETDTGVFSHGRVDSGTKVLLMEAPALPTSGHVLDLGCGDWQFSKFLDLSSVLYLGVDVVDSVIDSNIDLYSASNIDFISRDIITYELPQVDLIICKDVLQHLSNRDVISVLIKIIKSSKFALITNDFNSESTSNIDIDNGDYRYLDLTLSPFFLDVVTVLEFKKPGWRPKRTVTFT